MGNTGIKNADGTWDRDAVGLCGPNRPPRTFGLDGAREAYSNS